MLNLKKVKRISSASIHLGVSIVLIGGGQACSSGNRTNEKQRPNIIYIMSDDHTTQAFGIYGSRLSPLNPTPNPDPEYTHLGYQEYLKRYLRCVKGVDDNIGRLIECLKEEGLYDNTIIIYTGDQGFMLGEHDYFDKRWMYEEAMRMPFFVRYPVKIKPGTRTDAIINNTDFAPTIIEMAGGLAPDYMQGHSFKTILETGEEPASWQQSTYFRYWMHMAHRHANPGHFGIRTKDYKLIFFYGRNWKEASVKQNREGWGNQYDIETPVAWEFYNLKKDLFEMQNEYNNPDYKEIIGDLKIQLSQKRKALNEEDTKFPHIQEGIDIHWND